MAGIRSSSATVATIYTHFIIFVITAIFNFTVLDNTLPIRFGYGLCLVLLSLISLLLSLTSQDPDEAILRSLLMTISSMWTSIGVYHMVQSFADNAVEASEAFFSGYLTFLIAFMFFIAGGLHHKDRFSATLALGMFLSCIFEMAALWKPLRRSAAAYYLLLAAMALYLTISKLRVRYRRNPPKPKTSPYDETRQSNDYVPVAHAMNVLAAAAFAGQATGIYDRVCVAFPFVLVAGIYQLIFGVIAVRRNHVYNAMYFFFHGLFWLTNGFNLGVEFSTDERTPLLTAATIIHFIIFAVIAGISLTKELYQVLQNLVVCILCVAILVDTESLGFVSVMGWILFIFALYSLAAHISRVQNSGGKLPLGARLLSVQQLADAIIHSSKFLERRAQRASTASGQSKGNSPISIDFTLGYSRYGSFDLAGFAINAVAAVALVWTPQGLWILPWSVVFGGLSSMIIGSLCFAKGLSFESCAFFTFGALWMIWGPARGFGNSDFDTSPAVITGCIGFLAVGLLLLGLSSVINKAWTAVMFFFNLIVVGILLNAVNAKGAFIYEIVVSILFVIVCMYSFLAFSLKIVWGREVLPIGRPLIQVSYLYSQGGQAFWADGRTASGVKAIADIMNKGGICGIPTDVVYVLVAALKFPQAIDRAYNTKKLAEDRPMSMWISKVEQIEHGRPLFGEMVWGLMNEIWPSTVSLVIPKGEWYDTLGVGESGKYVGRPDSIAVRMPDNTVTSHLIDQTGPVAVSSANPTGEADTTHHLQVLAKLGLENVDGILCSGPSPENMASTVVDCRKLNEGKIGFFRIGVVPRSHVEAIVAKVKAYHDGTIPPSLSSRTTSINGGPHDNPVFQLEHENEVDLDTDSDVVNDNDDTNTDDDEVDNTTNDDYVQQENIGNNTLMSNSNSLTRSANTSFNDSITEDNVNLIQHSVQRRSKTEGDDDHFHDYQNRTSNASQMSGHDNKVYESIAPLPQINGHIKEDSKKSTLLNLGVNGQPQSNTNGESPYEPIQFGELVASKRVIGGGYDQDREPQFKVNPIFEDPSLKTEM